MKTFEFAIIASGHNPESDYETPLFEAGCDDATVSLQKGLLIIEFDREAVSFSRAVASACQNVKKAGFCIERVEPDHLVTLAEIADRANLSRQAVTLFAKGTRGLGFPAPAAKVTSKHPLWDWGEAASWLQQRGHVSLDAVVEARIVKEANAYLTAVEVSEEAFYQRLEQCEPA